MDTTPDATPATMDAPIPVLVVSGHYGSGKTEFAVSLAAQLATRGEKVAVGDLDIVNPYFRSRERAVELEQRGIRIISSSLGHNITQDLPAISAEIRGPIQDRTCHVILDVGGDSVGANALNEFTKDIERRGYEMLLVLNAYRPETGSVPGVLKHIEAIQKASHLTFGGIVVNTHMVRQTTAEDVLAGYELATQVSEASGLPIRYISAIPAALEGLPDDLVGERVPVGLFMREAWM